MNSTRRSNLQLSLGHLLYLSGWRLISKYNAVYRDLSQRVPFAPNFPQDDLWGVIRDLSSSTTLGARL